MYQKTGQIADKVSEMCCPILHMSDMVSEIWFGLGQHICPLWARVRWAERSASDSKPSHQMLSSK